MQRKRSSIYQHSARRIKADKLADVIQAVGATSTEASRMGPEEWEMVVSLADVHAPSLETQQLTIAILREREETRARVGIAAPLPAAA